MPDATIFKSLVLRDSKEDALHAVEDLGRRPDQDDYRVLGIVRQVGKRIGIRM
jgi:hypothetical protein